MENDDELMLITTEGIIIRIQVSDVTVLGRITTGVKLINLKEGVSVASIAKVVEDKTLMPPEEAKEEADESENSDEAGTGRSMPAKSDPSLTREKKIRQ